MELLESLDFSRPTVRMTRSELAALPEYSCSLPTGTTVGKRWKRDANAYRRASLSHLHPFDGTPQPTFRGEKWVVGEYARDPRAQVDKDGNPETVLILWSDVVLV